jgi:hypothetical protein
MQAAGMPPGPARAAPAAVRIRTEVATIAGRRACERAAPLAVRIRTAVETTEAWGSTPPRSWSPR